MDDLDRKLLDVLLRDGRASATQISEEVGLSRPAVADRIEKLERQGVIRGTTAVIDPGTLGRGITAFVTARGPKLGAEGWRCFRELMEHEEVLEVHTVAGPDCFLLKVRTESIQTLNALIEKLTEPPMSLSTRTTIVMATHCEKVGGIILGETKA